MLEFGDFIDKITKPDFERDVELLRSAFNFAKERHAGQIRKISGEPYFIHPLKVALLLRDFEDSVICAGLLHDVVEDTDTDIEELENRYGSVIARLVYGMTKESETKDIIKNLAEVAEKDITVLFVKLADRLDNLSDGILEMKEITLKKYIVETPKILELAEQYRIEFLVDEIEGRLAAVENFLNKSEDL